MSGAKRILEEADERERARWRPPLVAMSDDDLEWFWLHRGERERFRERRPGEFDALAEEEDLIGVTLVPIGGGLARIHPEKRWMFSDSLDS